MRPYSPELFGERLRALRGSRSLRQVEAETGIPLNTLSRLEQGQTHKPNFIDLIKLAQLYEIDLNQMAALTGQWVVTETEDLQLTRDELRLLAKLRNYLHLLDDSEKEVLVSHLDFTLDAHRRLRQRTTAEGLVPKIRGIMTTT